MVGAAHIALCVARAAVIRHSTFAAGIEQLGAVQSVAASLGVEVSPIGVGVRDIGGIEHAISAYSGSNAMAMSLIIA